MDLHKRLLVSLVGLCAVGCGGDATPGSDTTAGDIADTSDVVPPDVAPETDTSDVPEVPDVGQPDTANDADDAVAPKVIAATPGARCEPADRVGLVQIEDQGVLYASAWVYDRTNPVYGPPESTAGVCAFYRFVPGAAGCPACEDDETCGRSGQCEPLPNVRRDVALVLTAGDDAQRFESSGDYGELWGEVTLGGTLSVSLSFGGLEVTLGSTTVPAALEGVEGTLDGDESNPEGVEVTWTPVTGDTQVFTHVPMNHHVAEPSFTECVAGASSGALSIGGGMLKPLSVSTGLEFQGIEHVRFAAADTELGCVEIRFMVRAYVPLF